MRFLSKIDLSEPPLRKKAVLWHVAGGWLSIAIFMVQGILMVPLYISYMGDRLYGFWLATGGVLTWMSIVDLGASAMTQQRCAAAYGKRDLASVVQYFWHGFVVMIAILLMFAGCSLISSFYLDTWLGVDEVYVQQIVMSFLVVAFASLFGLLNNFMRNFAAALQRNQIPVLAQTAGDLCALIAVIVALVVFELGLWAIVISALVRSFVPLVFNLIHTVQILSAIGHVNVWSSYTFKDYFVTTPALIGSKVCGSLSQNLPLVLLTRFMGPESAVVYTVTMRAVFLVQNFINQALAALYGACSHFFSDPNVSKARIKSAVSQIALGFVILGGACVSCYALLNHGFVILWTSGEFYAGPFFTGAAALATFLKIRGSLFVGIGISFGEIRRFELCQAGEQLFHAFLIYIGIKEFGLIGAPLAAIIASIVAQYRFQMMFRSINSEIAKCFWPMNWLWVPLGGVIAVLAALSSFFVMESWLSFLSVSALVGIPFAAVVLIGLPDLRLQIVSKLSRYISIKNKAVQ
jgi:O-antigen/teichoic acid export membrane protein